MSANGMQEAIELMRIDGSTDEAIAVFSRFYGLLEAGASGLIPESSIGPVGELPRLADIHVDDSEQREALRRTAVIKLNGGLGTSMGMDRAKSLLPVKSGLTFIDIIARQVAALRQQFDVALPLIFMNSFRTQDDTRAALAPYGASGGKFPVDFLQSREPKLLVDGLRPVHWPTDPDLAWCPPGHGDLYPALRSSGVLDALLAGGYRYAFCSNSDNLGAVVDARIVAWMRAQSVPFLMESALRTPADRKGGHLAIRHADGRFVLRETAQTSPQDISALEDLTRHRYCNTNNLWVDLEVLRDLLDSCGGALELPLIRNVKTVDPSDSSSPAVVQIESAMGAAVELFAGARSVAIERDRFVPVKTTNDLLVLRSDVYEVDDSYRVVRSAKRHGDGVPFVDLDPRFYKLLPDFELRFPAGPPSLVGSSALIVRGDITFGAGVQVHGRVELSAPEGPLHIEDGTVLAGIPA
jgi:UTP--glucose-1-phosphate uridylyltransferase